MLRLCAIPMKWVVTGVRPSCKIRCHPLTESAIEEHCLKITLLGARLIVSQPEWRLLQLLSKRSGQIVSVEE